MKGSFERPSPGAAMYYKNAIAARHWLEEAVGYVRQIDGANNDTQLAHAEMPLTSRRAMICREVPREDAGHAIGLKIDR